MIVSWSSLLLTFIQDIGSVLTGLVKVSASSAGIYIEMITYSGLVAQVVRALH